MCFFILFITCLYSCIIKQSPSNRNKGDETDAFVDHHTSVGMDSVEIPREVTHDSISLTNIASNSLSYENIDKSLVY